MNVQFCVDALDDAIFNTDQGSQFIS
jgi:hypothetical protein